MKGNHSLNEAQRWLWSALILSMLLGYGFALMQIGATSGFATADILNHYRGNEAEMMFAMEYGQLVKLSHIHMLGMPLILTPAAWVFSQTDRFAPRARGLIIAAGYLGLAVILIGISIAEIFSLSRNDPN